MRALVLLLVIGARDADYDQVLAAWKAKRWTELDQRAARFLEEKPDYRYAHSVRYMWADSYLRRRSWKACERVCRDYLKLHADKKYAGKLTLVLARCLVEQRRFDEAAAIYASVDGEQAAYQHAVALFRGGKYTEARRALEVFLARWPRSKRAASARGYLGRIEPGYTVRGPGVVDSYEGKYKDDPRLPEVRKRVAALYGPAVARIERRVGKVEQDWLVRIVDAGEERSGRWAEVRTEVVSGRARNVLVLMTEHLMLDTHDLQKTLVHELYHCLQRQRLGAEAHKATPKWMREGAALYVAGQADERIRILAAAVGSNTRYDSPLERLVNGLLGAHSLDDYAEDVCAFLAVEQRHGRTKADALLKRLLKDGDPAGAIREVLGEDFATFDKATGAYARQRLGPLVETGRRDILAMRLALRKGDYAGAAGIRPGGVYADLANLYRASALFRLKRYDEALRAVRAPALRHTARASNAKLLELRILKAMGSEEYAPAAKRALLDLEPFAVYGTVKKVIDG